MRKKIFILLLGGIFFLDSCNNSDVPKPNFYSDLSSTINYNSCFLNPYDTVGKYHNEALKYVFEEYFKDNNARSRSKLEEKEILTNLIIDFLREKPFISGVAISKNDITEMAELSGNIQARSQENDVFTDEKQKSYFDRICDVFESETITSPQDLITKMNQVEEEIFMSDLSDTAKTQLLVSTAVAKYSSIFWMEQIMKEKPITSLSGAGPPTDDWLTWYQNVFMPNAENVFRADFHGAALGAITGMIFGGATGSAVPGLGTITVGVTGFVVGGAFGGIFGSAYEGIKIIFHAVLGAIED